MYFFPLLDISDKKAALETQDSVVWCYYHLSCRVFLTMVCSNEDFWSMFLFICWYHLLFSQYRPDNWMKQVKWVRHAKLRMNFTSKDCISLFPCSSYTVVWLYRVQIFTFWHLSVLFCYFHNMFTSCSFFISTIK